jgi:hypothetical protein
LSASANRQRISSIQTIPGQSRERWAYDGGLALSYEVDAFGRLRRGVEAAKGDAAAAQADADAVRLAVVSDTVRAYLDATTSAQREGGAGNGGLLDRSIRITGARVDVGRSDRLDLIRVSTLRDQQAASIPQLQADRQAALLRLATLTGRTPQPSGGAATMTPELKQPIPVGDGAALLARRPMCVLPNAALPPIRRALVWRRRISSHASRWVPRWCHGAGRNGCNWGLGLALVIGAAGQLDHPQYRRGAGADRGGQGRNQSLAGAI